MRIGPYKVISELGRGGMGVVYKATDSRNNQTVAIKMISGAGALHSGGRMGLVREARTLSELRHPNIVKIHDIGQHKGWLYIVMEYLEGGSLDRIIKAQRMMTVPEKIEIILQVCSGLGYAHARGVIHRDIKPANIFVLLSGQVRVVDFGLARSTEVTWSTKSAFAGTLLYMSPEQLSGVGPDARADIWAVGVTLYELLARKLPFNGTSVSSVIDSINHGAPAPLDNSFMLSSELNVVLRRALAKSRDARYRVIEDLATDLRNALALVERSPARVSTEPNIASGESHSNASPVEAPLYAPPDVGLQKRLQGRVEFERRGFNFRSGLRERIKQSLVTVDLQNFWYGCRWSGAALLLLALLGALGSISQGSTLDMFGVEIALIAMFIPAAGVGIFSVAVHHANVTIARKCRTCAFRHMRCVSRWSRFVTSNSEISMGLKDCISALQQGLFEDAAKLLSVHGSETPAIYTVIRYNLEFWECSACSDQSALIIVEDRIDQRWQRRNEYIESYQYAGIQGQVTHPVNLT